MNNKAAIEAHAELLKELGFPAGVVAETTEAIKLGLFDRQPSDDLVERTAMLCRELLASPKTTALEPDGIAAAGDSVAAYQMIMEDVLDLFGHGVGSSALASVSRLVTGCVAMRFAPESHRCSMVVVDNHNVFTPSWWDTDTGFMAIREALSTVNRAARQSRASPATVVMVLRPTIASYRDADFHALGKTLSGSGNVWLMPHGRAGMYKNQSVIVFGEERVITLTERYKTPGAAFGAFQESSERPAREVKANIDALTHQIGPERVYHWRRPTPVHYDKADARSLVKNVVDSGKGLKIDCHPFHELD